jgi:hypothetical protein
LHVTFIALQEAIPDLQRLADYTAVAADELEADLARIERRVARTRARQAPGKRTPPKALARSARRTAVR